MQTAVHGVSMLIQDYDDHSFVFASLGPSLVQCVESDSGLILLIEHDLIRKPVSTFRDHALKSRSGIHDRLVPQATFLIRCQIGCSLGLKRRRFLRHRRQSGHHALRRKGDDDLGAGTKLGS
jgi:hypothetical protein